MVEAAVMAFTAEAVEATGAFVVEASHAMESTHATEAVTAAHATKAVSTATKAAAAVTAAAAKAASAATTAVDKLQAAAHAVGGLADQNGWLRFTLAGSRGAARIPRLAVCCGHCGR
ncbi:hypothetical protein C7I85_22900 [Mesorhizobium soli]|uniref:Uncharacterized protein n=1 Tax=Pseudaminobacter soli (ex Li et al. 2025) TaxID=1295366 RepID=A0A2P7S3N6_9HYPH|nr:hypothetical protein C7I85_22900 [Mesorhizobium soli]